MGELLPVQDNVVELKLRADGKLGEMFAACHGMVAAVTTTFIMMFFMTRSHGSHPVPPLPAAR